LSRICTFLQTGEKASSSGSTIASTVVLLIEHSPKNLSYHGILTLVTSGVGA
jgi:hypothetical protein